MEFFMQMLIVATFCLAVFLLIRQLVLWYYRINERVALQKETVRLLRKIAGEASTDQLPEPTKVDPEDADRSHNLQMIGVLVVIIIIIAVVYFNATKS